MAHLSNAEDLFAEVTTALTSSEGHRARFANDAARFALRYFTHLTPLAHVALRELVFRPCDVRKQHELAAVIVSAIQRARLRLV